MAGTAVADGIRVVAATPHVRDDYPTEATEMQEGVGKLREALTVEGVELDVLTGGEIALDHLALLDADELARFVDPHAAVLGWFVSDPTNATRFGEAQARAPPAAQ